MKRIFAVLSPIVATSFLIQATLAQAPATACGTDSRNYTFQTDNDISIPSPYAAPLLIANGRGLIVHTGHYGAVAYYHGPAYGAQKAGTDKMAADFAKELRPHNIAAVSIWMGGLDTERARAYLAWHSSLSTMRGRIRVTNDFGTSTPFQMR